jgi:hypothetical protein
MGTEIFLKGGLDMQITRLKFLAITEQGDFILRSALFGRVSKDGNEDARSHPSRRRFAAPQDEGRA